MISLLLLPPTFNTACLAASMTSRCGCNFTPAKLTCSGVPLHVDNLGVRVFRVGADFISHRAVRVILVFSSMLIWPPRSSCEGCSADCSWWFCCPVQAARYSRSVPTSVYQTLTVLLVVSRLDYGDATIVGIPSRHLQSVINAAARSVAGLRRSGHITNTLASFHCRLRVPERIVHWQLWFTSRCTASHRSTLLMTCATLPKFQADDDYDQQALSSWRYPELGWLLSMTEPSALLDRGCGTVYPAPCHWVSDSRCFSSKTQTFPL